MSQAYIIPSIKVFVSVQHNDKCFTSSSIICLSGFVFDEIICIAVKIFPALQKPHNLIPAFVNPFMMSVYISVFVKCSNVCIF